MREKFKFGDTEAFLVKNTNIGPPVIVTHKPCRNQDIKNLKGSFLILVNLLSSPTTITL
jgi:hypothetical protein